MYARLVTVQVEPASVGDVVSALDCTEVPATRRQPGFKGRLVLHDATSGRIVLLTLWASKAAMRDGEARGALREELGVLAWATSGLDTALTLHRAAYEVSGSALSAIAGLAKVDGGEAAAPAPSPGADVAGGESGGRHQLIADRR